MRNDSNFGAESRNCKRQTGPDVAWALLMAIAEKPRMVAAFLVTLLVGILSSSAAQQAALCAVIGAIVLVAVHASRRRDPLESAPRTGGAAAEASQRYSSTLLLHTITHFSRIEALIKRPCGMAASQRKP